jgi:hypothetical protein
MTEPAPHPTNSRRRWELLIGIGSGAALVLVVILIAVFQKPAGQTRGPTGNWPPRGRMPTPFTYPGVKQPPVVSAADARLADDAAVIGVCIEARYRAYAVSAFTAPMSHVVNDLVGDIPVTVTLCVLDDCTRVYTDKSRGKPLDVWLGGIAEKGLFLKLGNRMYYQETGNSMDPQVGPFPYTSIEFENTTWGKWRQAHPDTDVYVSPPHPKVAEES